MQPRITGELPRSKVKEILEETGAKHIFVTDSRYRTTDLDMIKDFLELDDTDKMDYTRVWRDCDDFAFRLMGQFHLDLWAGIAVGIAISETHAYNLVITRRSTLGRKNYLYIIEPKNDNTYLFSRWNGDPYKPVEVIIM
jgi:hypothetical protein